MTSATISGRAYPLGLDNVDTDMIIAAAHLKTLSRAGLGRHVFGTLRQDRANIFDHPRYRSANILVAGQNFGCGSSREHAVWALKDLGIEAVIAGSFSDIFAGNALKNGLAAIAMRPDSLALVLGHARAGFISIDLDRKFIAIGDEVLPFAMDEGQRAQLLSGAEEIELTLAYLDQIESHERRRGPWIPRTLG